MLLVLAMAMAACSSSPVSPPVTHPGSLIPAVGNAANLSVAPVVSRGSATPPTSLVEKNLVIGTGATAVASNTVLVQYVGVDYATGKVFDSSWERGQPTSFPLDGVIPGFAQGIVGMKVGAGARS